MAEFTLPSFLEHVGVEDWKQLIRETLPADIDLSEGGHAYNLTITSAIIAAKVCEYIIPRAIEVFHPAHSYGTYLDDHARARSMTRHAATAATGEITITGEANTLIPNGSQFSTASINDEPALTFETEMAVTIPEEGSVTVPVRCITTGTIGNTAANTIIIPTSGLTGVTSVTNNLPTTGGTEEESDESLIARIEERDRTQSESYTGCVADYERWARAVDGVGDVTVIPAQDDSGLVRLVITDSNGEPASEQLRETVYNHIMHPEDKAERKTAPNVLLSVESPETQSIWIRAKVELEGEATIESVEAAFLQNLSLYLPTAMEDGVIRITKLGQALSTASGVSDYKDIEIGTEVDGEVAYNPSNLALDPNILPILTINTLALTEAEV